MHITDLPSEIILEIFSYLSQPFLITALKHVCRKWKELSTSPILWRNLDLYHQDLFLNLPREKLEDILQSVAFQVHILRSKTTSFYSKFQPEVFTHLKSLHLRMFDDDKYEQLQSILQCYPDLDTFKLDVTRFDRPTDVITLCKVKLTKLRRFHLRHFFCNHSSKLKLMPNAFQALFQSTNMLSHVTVNCGDIYLDVAIQTLLERNQNLEELNVSRCTGLTNVAFSRLQSCKLRSLTLNRTAVDDEGLKTIAENSPHLKLLSVSKCKNITDKGMKYIAEKCKYLQSLQINYCTSSDCCKVTNTGLVCISEGCRDLRYLMVNYHPLIDGTCLSSIALVCPNLRILQMEKINNVNDKALIMLAQHCRFLEKTDFNYCTNITGSGVSRLLTGCRWLNYASFSSCFGIRHLSLVNPDGLNSGSEMDTNHLQTDTSVTHEDSYCFSRLMIHSHIQNLHFTHCENMTVNSFIEMSAYCPDLNSLSITGWAKENIDVAFFHILRNCNNLHSLLCFGLKENEETNFTEKSLDAMIEYGHTLKRLQLSLNYSIGIDALHRLLMNCKKLEHLDIYVNDHTEVSVTSIKHILQNCHDKKIVLQSYKRLSNIGCVISIERSCNGETLTDHCPVDNILDA